LISAFFNFVAEAFAIFELTDLEELADLDCLEVDDAELICFAIAESLVSFSF